MEGRNKDHPPEREIRSRRVWVALRGCKLFTRPHG